jgi:hypothetical protein
MSQDAVELKNKGNKAFSAGDWPTAVEFYTKAIDLDDKEPTFLTNRAQVRPLILDVNRCGGRVTDSSCLPASPGAHQSRSIRLCHCRRKQSRRAQSETRQGRV